MEHKKIKDIARIISCTNATETVNALAIYFEDNAGFDSKEFRQLASVDTLSTSMTEKEWAYTPTSTSDRMDAIKKSRIRMELESGYGVPDEEWDRQICLLNNGED
tara:strand:- start:9931 stop:10245 length:315 start_codon:yes stop_codon:yes gene_type:complete